MQRTRAFRIFEGKYQDHPVDDCIDLDLVRPSGAKQWFPCDAAIPAISKIKGIGYESPSGPAADEGTVAHWAWQISNQPWLDGFFHRSDCRYGEEIIDDVMLKHVADCNTYIEQVCKDGSYKYNCETVVPRFYDIDRNCTVDMYYFDGETLHIYDLKYGKGVAVFAKNNVQLLVYAISLIAKKIVDGEIKLEQVKFVCCHIMQPRKNSWTCERYDLKRFRVWETDIYDQFVKITSDPHGAKLFAPDSKNCQFCPIDGECSGQLVQNATQLPKSITGVLNVEKVDAFAEVSSERLKQVCFTNKKTIENWLKKGYEVLMQRKADGELSDELGLELEDKVGNRAWVDQALAGRSLSRTLGVANAFKKTIITPTQALDMLKKESKDTPKLITAMKRNIHRPITGQKLVNSKVKEGNSVFTNNPKPLHS